MSAPPFTDEVPKWLEVPLMFWGSLSWG